MSEAEKDRPVFSFRISLGNVLTLCAGAVIGATMLIRIGQVEAALEGGIKLETQVREAQLKAVDQRFSAIADDVHEIRDILFKQAGDRKH